MAGSTKPKAAITQGGPRKLVKSVRDSGKIVIEDNGTLDIDCIEPLRPPVDMSKWLPGMAMELVLASVVSSPIFGACLVYLLIVMEQTLAEWQVKMKWLIAVLFTCVGDMDCGFVEELMVLC